MEFYREYIDDGKILATEKLNIDVKHNPQWKSEVCGYSLYDGNSSIILVRWVGLGINTFKESD